MRISRFFILTIILFFGCFWWAGGDTVGKQALSTTVSSLDTLLPATDSTIDTDTDEHSALKRIYRLIRLKSAVEHKVHRESFLPLEDVNPAFCQAIIAVEDSRFYEHYGFDVSGIMRASLVNLQYGQVEEGASTITQQLAKNLFLSHERSLSRKIEEFALSVDLEMNYSKQEILETYINTIYFGSGYYGIHAAAIGYFGRPPINLNIAECAMLAGLPNAPSVYSPYVNFKAAKQRQSIVLDRMRNMGYISAETAEDAKHTPIWLAN